MELEIFLLKFLGLVIHNEVPKLKLFPPTRLVDKTTAKQPKIQQFHRVVGSVGSSRDIW
jgi:hypothetical protein